LRGSICGCSWLWGLLGWGRLSGPGEVAVRIALTPFVQARMLALHRVVGWGLYDPPLGWSFVLAPLVGCTFGGRLYGVLCSRRSAIRHSP